MTLTMTLKKNFRRLLAAALVLGASLSVTFAAPKKSKVKIVNKSDWTIMELYMSPTDDNEWGDDLLEKHVIKPGENFTLTDIPCDSWDVKLVDEDKDVCVVEDVNMCANNETWVIDSKSLLACQGSSR